MKKIFLVKCFLLLVLSFNLKAQQVPSISSLNNYVYYISGYYAVPANGKFIMQVTEGTGFFIRKKIRFF